MKYIIEAGSVLNLKDSNIIIDENLTVYKEGIPIGNLKDNLKWFTESDTPKIENIENIVYIKPYVWSIKHFTPILDEFVKLKDNDKSDILSDLVQYRNSNEFVDIS